MFGLWTAVVVSAHFSLQLLQGSLVLAAEELTTAIRSHVLTDHGRPRAMLAFKRGVFEVGTVAAVS